MESPSRSATNHALDAPTADGLRSASFLGLLVTQFLGAVNDNMFRWLVIGIGKDYAERHASVILSSGLICFVLPYLFLAAPAGFLADRFSKRAVIVWCKVAELAILTLGVAAILVGGWTGLAGLFGVMLLLGCQAALFGPSKLGCIPELVRGNRISAANGMVGLTTVIATVVGAAAGNYLYDLTRPYGQQRWWISAVALLGVSAVGWLASLFIKRLSPANPDLRWPKNVARETWANLRTLAGNRPLMRVALGIAFFWSVGSLAQLNIDQFGAEGGLEQKGIVPLLISLVVGVGLGSVLAGLWSGDRVELGMLPVGAGGVALCSMLMFTVEGDLTAPETIWTRAFIWACVLLFGLGVSAGLFNIPLAAYMQQRSPRQSRGAILAASNFITFSGILCSALLYPLLRAPLLATEALPGAAASATAQAQSGVPESPPEVSPARRPLFTARQIFMLTGLFTIPVLGYVLWLLPHASMRFAVAVGSLFVYRLRVHGRENLPESGALLISNHISWIDGILLLLVSHRPIRMLVDARYVESWWIRGLARMWGAIKIQPGRRSVVESLRICREALAQGDLVCIFPEGGISRTGQLMAFKPGLLRVAQATGAPVVPVYLDGLWGSIFSFKGGKFFWKWPRRWLHPLSVHFGLPISQLDDADQVRRAVAELGVQAVERRKSDNMILPRLFLRMCRRNRGKPKIGDSMGTEMTGATLLLRTLIVRRLLLRRVLAPDEKYVGVLLPPSAGAVLANAALPLCGRIAVNLNYSVSADVMNACIRQCGIKHVLTSGRVLEKLNLKLDAEMVLLEDFRERVTTTDKAAAAVQAFATPMWLLERQLGLLQQTPDDVLTVIFTSGSTGEPKGVMLTHENVGSNVLAIDQIVRLNREDVLAGILPFFHSFGYTTTLWTALTLDLKGVYHISPLDARQVGELCRKQQATILISTPTFLRSYLKRCPPEDFAALSVVVAGAEQLPVDLCDAFENKYKVRPVEGYGATELSPLVAVNVPPSRSAADTQVVCKEGTVGRPIPGVAAKVVHPETGQELGLNQAGMLLIKGPNVMKGYLGQPEMTAKVMRDGWYVTGDIAIIDDDGFIKITGRESRFSKIGGEMVPHIRIEEVLQKILASGDDDLKAVVTAVPDSRKGERLIVMHTAIDKAPDAICKELQQAGLPNLWIPSPDSFCRVDEIPVLGTGKLDLKGLKQLAMEKFAES